MPATRTHDIVASVGEYTDRQSGEKKKRYVNCGSAFTDENGRISLKIDTIPVSPEWSGWFSLYEVDRNQRQGGAGQQRPRTQASSSPKTKTAVESVDDLDDDSIPF